MLSNPCTTEKFKSDDEVQISAEDKDIEVEVDVCDNTEKSREESDKGTAAQAVLNDATTDTTNDTTEEGVTKVRQL